MINHSDTGAAGEAARTISVFLADDNLLVREGVRALLSIETDLEVVGVAADFDELIAGATEAQPQVLVTDIRMPPNFQNEGIEAAKAIRKRHPGTGVVILSQYDEPEYAISLLADGAAGYAYLLKDRVSDGNRLARAIREVATGGSMLDPEIVQALVARRSPHDGELTEAEEQLLRQVAEGRPLKAIAISLGSTPEAMNDTIEQLFLEAGARRERRTRVRAAPAPAAAEGDRGSRGAGRDAEPASSRLASPRSCATPTRSTAPSGLNVTVLMSDVRGYSGIAERTDPTALADQLRTHRSEMNAAILEEDGHRHAVRRRRGHGRVRRAVPPGRPRRPRHAGRDRDARTTGGGERQLGGGGPRPVRPGHRPVDR